MIHEILSPEKCAACKGCCHFAEGEEWEAPAPLSPPTAESRGCSVCVHLTENGCRLGQSKPLECSMYPFRVMQMGGSRLITLSKYCKPVTGLPLSCILQFAENKSAEFLALADSHPEIVKEYNGEYVILKVVCG